MMLQELLRKISPCSNVKIRDFDGENILFAGHAGEVPETAFFKYAEVRTHYFASETVHINVF